MRGVCALFVCWVVSCAPSPRAPVAPAVTEEVPLFDGLGALHRPITTSSPEAQRYFDQGLAFLYAFNHLKRLPGNVWSLHGLARSLRVQKKDAEAKDVEARLAKALTGADIELTSSCMCLPGI